MTEPRGRDFRGFYRLVKPGRLQPGDLVHPDIWRVQEGRAVYVEGRKVNVAALVVPVVSVTATRAAGRAAYVVRVARPEGFDPNLFADRWIAYPTRNLRVYDPKETP